MAGFCKNFSRKTHCDGVATNFSESQCAWVPWTRAGSGLYGRRIIWRRIYEGSRGDAIVAGFPLPPVCWGAALSVVSMLLEITPPVVNSACGWLICWIRSSDRKSTSRLLGSSLIRSRMRKLVAEWFAGGIATWFRGPSLLRRDTGTWVPSTPASATTCTVTLYQ